MVCENLFYSDKVEKEFYECTGIWTVIVHHLVQDPYDTDAKVGAGVEKPFMASKVLFHVIDKVIGSSNAVFGRLWTNQSPLTLILCRIGDGYRILIAIGRAFGFQGRCRLVETCCQNNGPFTCVCAHLQDSFQ